MSRVDHLLSRAARRLQPCGCVTFYSRTELGRTQFFREEFLKHQRCLERQREYFSEEAIQGVQCALRSILSRLDALCQQQDCEKVLSAMLKKLDAVTRLSSWDEPARTH